jgi:hypothetical protein
MADTVGANVASFPGRKPELPSVDVEATIVDVAEEHAAAILRARHQKAEIETLRLIRLSRAAFARDRGVIS